MGHEVYFLLLYKEKAKDSFEARKLVLWKLQEEIDKRILSGYYEAHIGGEYSGLLSICDESTKLLPYQNLDLRKLVKEKIAEYVPWIKDQIAKKPPISMLAKDLKKTIPGFKNYTDSDLLDALRLELYPMSLGVDFNWNKTGDILFTFNYDSSDPSLWQNGRYEFTELGYDDDAMIIDECIYEEVIVPTIKRGSEILVDLEKEKISKENLLDKKWIVLVERSD